MYVCSHVVVNYQSRFIKSGIYFIFMHKVRIFEKIMNLLQYIFNV